MAGLVTGATVWLAGTATTLLGAGGILGGLAAQPALLSVPAACLAIVLVSLARPDRGPDGALDAVMRRLHTP